ncbi:MAG: hypothetical protein M1824_004924 [Vezdaea acicularis]|nr:MAG: hypothetical protein M1824_004924 [Vezdaea acicularis]
MSYAQNPPAPPPKPNTPRPIHISLQGGQGSLPLLKRQESRDITHGGILNGPTQVEPGKQWLPEILRDKSKPDLSDVLKTPALLDALSNSPSSIPPGHVPRTHPAHALQHALSTNLDTATEIAKQEACLLTLRSKTETQLLHLHTMNSHWRNTQARLDKALSPFSPPALYQRLAQSISEQEAYCQALEESFLDEDGKATDRELSEFLRRFREGRKTLYLREERKKRWDEGRVGGWR